METKSINSTRPSTDTSQASSTAQKSSTSQGEKSGSTETKLSPPSLPPSAPAQQEPLTHYESYLVAGGLSEDEARMWADIT